MNHRYIVLYTQSGSNTVSVVLDRDCIDLPFIADCKTYIFTTNIQDKAYYVSSFLNANVTNTIIMPFQSHGLMGVRDVHRKILSIPFELYDPKNQIHAHLANLAKAASAKTQKFIEGLTTKIVSKCRNAVRANIRRELDEIDDIWSKYI